MDHKKYKKIAVGGTFDKFHDGHKKLLATAFELGEEVEIGVTSNAFGGLKGDIDSCEDRMRCLKEFFKDRLNYTVMVLDDAYGTTVFDDEFDAIVVSEETEPVAVEINEIRDSKGMSLLDIVVVSFVLADDGHPISSTRIRSGEINKKVEKVKVSINKKQTGGDINQPNKVVAKKGAKLKPKMQSNEKYNESSKKPIDRIGKHKLGGSIQKF